MFKKIVFTLLVIFSFCTLASAKEVDVHFTNEKPLKKNIYGISKMLPSGYMSIQEFINYDLLKDLKFQSFRHTAGWGSGFIDNFHDRFMLSEMGKFNNYNFKSSIRAFIPYAKDSSIDSEALYAYLKKRGTELIYIPNLVTTYSVAKEVQAIFKNRLIEDYGLKFIELGNELYWPVFRKQRSSQDLADNVKQFITLFKKMPLSENVKLGLPIGGIPDWRISKDWDNAVNRISGYDAVVFHPYATNPKYSEQYYGSDLYQYVHRKLPYYIKNIRNQFHKPIWLTEWNIDNDPHKDGCNTFQGNIFILDFLNYISHQDDIPIASFHRLFSNQMSLINIKRVYNKRIFTYNSSYYIWKMILRAVSSSSKSCSVSFDSRNFNCDNLFALGFASKNNYFAIVANNTNEIITFRNTKYNVLSTIAYRDVSRSKFLFQEVVNSKDIPINSVSLIKFNR